MTEFIRKKELSPDEHFNHKVEESTMNSYEHRKHQSCTTTVQNTIKRVKHYSTKYNHYLQMMHIWTQNEFLNASGVGAALLYLVKKR